MKTRDNRSTARWIWVAAIVLALLHQDFWYWDDRTLVLGFLPIGLAYHMLFSLAAGGLWALAVKYAWPSRVEAWADEVDDPVDTADVNGGHH